MGRSGRLRLRQIWRAGFWAVVLILAGSTNSAWAQSAYSIPATDANGVNVATGGLTAVTHDVSIGQPGAGGLSYGRTLNYTGAGGSQPNIMWRDSLSDGISSSTTGNYTVVLDGVTDNFTYFGSGNYVSWQIRGTTLSYNSTTGIYTYTTHNGTVATFSTAILAPVSVAGATMVASVASVAYPNGEVHTYTYKSVAVSGVTYTRLQSMTNNFGYQLKASYSSNTLITSADAPAWQTLSSVTAINNAVDYCDPTADTCSGLSTTWPSATYASSTVGSVTTLTATDAMGRTTTITESPQHGSTAPYVTKIQPALSTANPTTFTYNTSNQIASVSNGVGTWTYAYANNTPASGSETTTNTDPLGHTKTFVTTTSTSSLGIPGLVTSSTDGLGRTTGITYWGSGLPWTITHPEGDQTVLGYVRGALESTTLVPKSGSGLSNIVTTVNIDSTCTYPAKCNEPNSTLDANNNETDYTYNTTTGQILTKTLPAATTGGVRPQTRYTYTSLYAWYKNSAGTIVQAATPVSMLTGISTCATTASCGGAADEIKTTITYGTSGVANNLLPTSVTTGAGNGSLAATASTTYDAIGNVSTVTPPLGSAETSMYRYDADREVIGVVGPTPGESGLANPAARYTLNPDGLITLTEKGTVASQSDADWASFSSLEQQATTYDTLDRKASDSLTSGGVTLALTQYSYDNANRLTCAAARINPATFGSEPSSACTLGTPLSGANDRIVRNTYDNADELTISTKGYGTSLQAPYATQTYSSDGLLKTILDANSNLTSYTYDGVNRASQVNFPLPTKGSNASSTTDYESFTYDANSNILTDRKRDGSTLTFTYDFLNRIKTKTPSVGGGTVNYAYDLLNRGTSALYASSGLGVTYVYDALSRKITETTTTGALSYAYDIGGNLTKITWPDSFYATYAYDALNRMTTVQDSSGGLTGAYITYAYDNLGRRTGMARGNATSTTYGYDGADRLSGLSQTLTGSGSVSFSANYNAVSQLLSRSSTNAAYTSHPSSTTPTYVINGLNQYSSVNGASFTYDAKANLTSDGVRTFTYDVENRLLTETGGPHSVTLSYDPTGRLQQSVGSTTTQFLYGGSQLLAEYSGTTVLRRYVPGANADEPVIWYEGSGFTDRRWLHTDNQGSIIAYTDGTGTAQATYGYGPYGEPNAWSGSRYRYTGQIEIPEANLYYYKARVYDPTLERFLQTDPAGYQGDINPYAYTGNDPINGSDPSGQLECVGPLCGTNVSDVVSGEVIVQGVRQPTINPILIINTNVFQIIPPTINLPTLQTALTKNTRCSAAPEQYSLAGSVDPSDFPSMQPNSGGINFDALTGQVAIGGGAGKIVGDYNYNAANGWTYSGKFAGSIFGAGVGAAGGKIWGNSDSLGAMFGSSWGTSDTVNGVTAGFSANLSGTTVWGGLGVGLGGTLDYSDLEPIGYPHATGRWKSC